MGEKVQLHATKFGTELFDYSKARAKKKLVHRLQTLGSTPLSWASDLVRDDVSHRLPEMPSLRMMFVVEQLKTLRDHGHKTVLYEAGDGLGGTWRLNCFPGAGTWNWTSNYPSDEELRAYFNQVDEVVDIRKDCASCSVVAGARFDKSTARWIVKTSDDRTAKAKYLILATPSVTSRSKPPWSGLDIFKGAIHHSSFWPEGKVNGQASLAIPMWKRELNVAEKEKAKGSYSELFRDRAKTFAGFILNWYEKNTCSH
ncbi:hypothetical protein GGS21DRAFT_494234 [Xylaria nigripes]|nr:hypothetical protein GGS21DRAFT_494234 [Xylaria nigripes]